MTEAIINNEDLIAFSADKVEEAKQRALAAPRGRFRFCLHHSHDDPIQEMLIACKRGTYLRPHRNRSAKEKSYHVVSGEMAFFQFDDHGRVLRRIDLSELGSGRPFLLRYFATVWHMPVVLSDLVVYVEVNAGPYRTEIDPEYAPWSLAEEDPRASEYLESLLEWRGEH